MRGDTTLASDFVDSVHSIEWILSYRSIYVCLFPYSVFTISAILYYLFHSRLALPPYRLLLIIIEVQKNFFIVSEKFLRSIIPIIATALWDTFGCPNGQMWLIPRQDSSLIMLLEKRRMHLFKSQIVIIY